MKRTMIILYLAFIAASAEAVVKFHSASNALNGKVVVEVWGKGRDLQEIDLKSGESSPLPWPVELKDQEIIGSILLSDRLLVIAQWTAGGGKYPSIYQYDRKTKTWNSSKVSLDCISFDTVELSKSKLSVECEADPLKDKKPATVTAQLSGLSITGPVKYVWPLTESVSGEYSYKLDGDILDWPTLRLFKNNQETKKIQAESLATK